ncbi:hypothetical protein Q3G72_031392 [Acer saccharum]|nr:hypothetical protein Q3G72_031392 [Acer saccharum]
MRHPDFAIFVYLEDFDKLDFKRSVEVGSVGPSASMKKCEKVCFLYRNIVEKFSKGVDEIDSEESLRFNFSTIKAATNDFPDDNKLGQGGFGAVYKGRLPNGQDIAVKRLSTNSGQGDLEFKNEVLLVAKLQHRNLVRLLGFCLEGRERLLIYEFVPNSSLDNFIFDPIKRGLLNWETRPAGVPSCSLNITQMAISGEPVEKLFLWGHSACTLGNADHDYKVLIFGGFGGMGRHSRRNDTLLLDPLQGTLEGIHTEGSPLLRLGHASSLVGDRIVAENEWRLLECTGNAFPPSFDVHKCLWKKEEVAGKSPHARFSHSMFLYKNYLGVIGGCPVGQHDQVLALLDLQLHVWKYVKLNSMSEELILRCTANVVGNDLVMIGGGAACYAFGTKFSEPIKINLLPVAVMSRDDCHVPSEHSKIGEKPVTDQYEGVTGEINVKFEGLQIGNSQTSTQDSHSEAEHLGRKAYPQGGGTHICFPITENFCVVFHEKQHHFGDKSEALNNFIGDGKLFTGESILLNEIPSSAALHLLKECGATKQADDVVEVRRASKSPLNTMTEAVASLLQRKGLSATLLEQLPSRWERLGDIVVLPVTAFKDPAWDSIGDELWPIIAKSLNTSRLARQGCVAPTGIRDSTLEILTGDNGWVNHCENGILYSFNATKCMFSWGNLSKKLRTARLDCTDEVIVDWFARIGYFVLPFLVRDNVIIIILVLHYCLRR